MKRRKFFERLGLASAAAVSTPILSGTLAADDQEHDHGHGHDDEPLSGDQSNATVSFGAWQSKDNDPAAVAPQNMEYDRYLVPNDRNRNSHHLTPFEATIVEGGTVNFIVGGFHEVIVYAPGKKPTDVNSTLIRPTMGGPGGPAGVPLINDRDRRVFAGVDPSTQPSQDRVEVVEFPNPGRHLVICGVQGHFLGGMFGYVRVLRRRH